MGLEVMAAKSLFSIIGIKDIISLFSWRDYKII